MSKNNTNNTNTTNIMNNPNTNTIQYKNQVISFLKEDFKEVAQNAFVKEVENTLRFLVDADNLEPILREYLEGNKYEEWQAVLSDAFDKVAEFADKMGINTEL